MKGLIVKTDGSAVIRQLDGYTDLNAAVGGYIERLGGDGWNAYCNEEGKLKRLPVNADATELAAALGWIGLAGDILVGDVVFFGPVDEEDEETDVPALVLQAAADIGLTVEEA